MPAETATDPFIAEFRRRYMEHKPPSLGIGRRPAVLVVDFIEGFTNPESPLAGDWDLQVRNTAELIRAARKAVSMPVIFTTVEFLPQDVPTLLMALKTPRIAVLSKGSKWCDVDHRLPRTADDIVISKKYGSAFFGTSLASQLHVLGIDTLFIAGCVTSGCVRASAVDAAQSGFRPIVIREAVGDRSALANEANLLDIECRYGDVISMQAAMQYLR
ncbi:MAG: isochorismatase family protein [Woeseia sp.]